MHNVCQLCIGGLEQVTVLFCLQQPCCIALLGDCRRAGLRANKPLFIVAYAERVCVKEMQHVMLLVCCGGQCCSSWLCASGQLQGRYAEQAQARSECVGVNLVVVWMML